MSNFELLIRFGVHKDRETLRHLRDRISGIVVPAHILCHSTDATVAAISYIDKGYYIDPMTYIYAVKTQDYLGPDKKKFKPSIEKMTADYGLSQLFEQNGYNPLIPSNLTADIIHQFCEKSLILQQQKIDSRKTGTYNIPKYIALLMQVGENHIADQVKASHTPKTVIPPYFFIDSVTSDWLGVNIALNKKTSELTQSPVTPLICCSIEALSPELLNAYSEYNELFLWVNDFDERDASLDDLKKYLDFIILAKSQGVTLRNMYGTYFSILASKFGLKGVSCGIFYGESKNVKASVGGIPGARYYIRKLHQFFILPEAGVLIKNHPDLLDTECLDAIKLISGNPTNIYSFASNHALAQLHFVYSREFEADFVARNSIKLLSDDLKTTHTKYATTFSDNKITKKSIDYLNRWSQAILDSSQTSNE